MFQVPPPPPGYQGAHRAEAERVLPKRLAGVAVAVGVLSGAGAAAHAVTTGTFNPVAGGADLGGVPEQKQLTYTGKAATVHSIDLGSETARIVRQDYLTALNTFNQASGVAQDGWTARQAAEEQARKDAIEAAKPPKQRQVEGWIKEAIGILAANGTRIDESSVDEIYTIIIKESGGNPNAVNTWDSNAVRGTPSKGLMQCIDPTFQSYKIAGYDDIYAPVDNIIAGVRYTYARYGGFHNHPGLVSIASGNGYLGY
ncbi:transglycosylase SLT domain-containing protein [Saccharothrix longispora]|uniref:transglycosylase SLT domain-containing protein n=1 Tax=Saccharothrix longispora TaxID=33920 RepID=UPI00398D255E